MNHSTASQSWISLVVPIVLIAVVFTVRTRRMATVRPLKPELLWIVPALYAVIAGLVFWSTPPTTALVWISCGLALVVGVALGWQRGRMMHISVDPSTGTLRQKASFAAMAVLLVLVAVRTAAREAVQLGGLPVDIKALTDVLIALAFGLLTAQRVEMYLRARRLLATARASA